jgi:hypothetical protein
LAVLTGDTLLVRGEIMASESATSAGSSDPLKAVADAMDAAVRAAKEGAEDARTTAVEALPAAGQMLSRLVYNTCYAVSYGVVFPTVFVARSLPANNAAMHGFVDGAHAAVDMVREMKHKSAAGDGPAAAPGDQGGAAPAAPHS